MGPRYITEIVEETHSKRQRYEWQIKGWSRYQSIHLKEPASKTWLRCSRECGGGTRHLVTRCYHPVTGKVRLRVSFKYVSSWLQRIRNRLCGPKRSRPGRREKSCNTFRSGLRKLGIAHQSIQNSETAVTWTGLLGTGNPAHHPVGRMAPENGRWGGTTAIM